MASIRARQISRSSAFSAGDGNLGFQMFLQRAAVGDGGFKTLLVAVEAAAGFHRGPVGQGLLAAGPEAGGGVSPPSYMFSCAAWSMSETLEKSSRARDSSARSGRRFAARRASRSACARRRVVTLQQRILFQFGFAIFRQFDVGQLQQLDRLLQLRRHHQGLALPDFQSLPDSPPFQPILIARISRPDRRGAHRGR